jgi:NAD+ kinase
MKIALYGRVFTTDFSVQIHELIALLHERGVDFSVYEPFGEFLRQSYSVNLSGVTLFNDMPPAGSDCLISIGGDGTFLRSLKRVRDAGIPVIGINSGRLGFLSAAAFHALPSILDALLQRQYSIEERTLLEVQSEALPPDFFAYALNEAGIQRLCPAVIGIRVQLDGVQLPTYWSDGLLVATPTGSTAYSMSVGGPIIMPQAKSFIISPIAPHNLNIRPLIIADDSVLSLTVESRSGNTFLTVDNQLFEIRSGAVVTVRKAPFTFRTIRLHGATFFDTLSEKLSWGRDNRN